MAIPDYKKYLAEKVLNESRTVSSKLAPDWTGGPSLTKRFSRSRIALWAALSRFTAHWRNSMWSFPGVK